MATVPLTVTEILSGDSFKLTDGTTVRLLGIKAPDETALAETAREQLAKLIGKQPIVIEKSATDRYGRITGLVFAGKTWLQGEMLRAGLAEVYPPLGDEPRLAELQALENTARQNKRGLWERAGSEDITPEQAQDQEGKFVAVRGRVVDAVRVKNKYFLNFGENWRDDFTIMIKAGNARAFKKAKIDLLKLKGKQVRVRGMVQSYYGPMIEVTSLGQMEISDR